MSDSQEILEAIETRLAEAREEIKALGAARVALLGRAKATRSARPATESRSVPGRVRASRSAPREVRSNGAASSRPSTGVRTARASKPATRGRALPAGAIELALQEQPAGLSAAALTKLTGASHNQVTARLRDLEHAGDVRRSGARRTSLWRLVTDEEQIAERAAELEKAQRPTASANG